MMIGTVAPSLFAANANGQGVAAAVALRVRADGSQSFEPVARFDAAQNRFVAIPIDLGPSADTVFLIPYGTGIRYRGSLMDVQATIGRASAQEEYAGPAPGFVGLDRLNVRLPRSLIGRGEVDAESSSSPEGGDWRNKFSLAWHFSAAILASSKCRRKDCP